MKPSSERAAALIARMRETRARAEALVGNGPFEPVLPDVMTPDHPIAKAIGFERANALVDTPARRRANLARSRRDAVKRLSLDGKLVREIAAELGLSYDYVVALRAQLGVGRVR
jgi:hypothetical protein